MVEQGRTVIKTVWVLDGVSWIHCIILQIEEWQVIPINNILGHVGESGHHTAAESTAEDLHVTGLKPLISCSVIVLCVIGSGEAVETPDSKDSVINYFNAEIAAGGHHWGNYLPGVGPGVVGLCTAQTVVSIKATNLWKKK